MVVLDKIFTAEGSPNIALIKYWGKRDEKLILPYNSSISITLSPDTLHTTTSIIFSKKLKEDVFYLDGKLQDLSNPELAERFTMLDKMRRQAGTDAKALIVSVNNFPAGSGIASSASGLATLAYALNAALELDLSPRELSIMARQGSGSACRSIFGGVVVWHKGVKSDGIDSYAEQIFSEGYWPEIIDDIAIVSQDKKKVSSRAGMKQTVETNPLYKARPESPENRQKKIIEAYKRKDFNALAEHIMADSNEMHALMMSTTPPIRYLNGVSYEIMDRIERLNESEGRNIAAYSFDAGPNAHIITLRGYQPKVRAALRDLLDSGKIVDLKTSGIGSGPKLLREKDTLITPEILNTHASKG